MGRLGCIEFDADAEESPLTITHREAATLRTVIRHQIIREYRTIDRDAVRSVYEPLFDLIFQYVNPAEHCLPIFTTNYDLAIELLCETSLGKYHLTEGLDLDSISKTASWNRGEFDRYSLWDNHPKGN
jgi:hypothetical protein